MFVFVVLGGGRNVAEEGVNAEVNLTVHVSFTSSSSAAEAPTCVCVCCVGGGRDIAGEKANVEKATLADSTLAAAVSNAVAAVFAAVDPVIAAVIAAVAAAVAAVAVAAVSAAVIDAVAADTAATSASLSASGVAAAALLTASTSGLWWGVNLTVHVSFSSSSSSSFFPFSSFVGVDSGELKTNGSCTVTMAEGVDSEKEEFGKTESAALPPGQPKGEPRSNVTPAWVGVPKDAPNAPNACTSVESDCGFGSATSSIFVDIVVVVSKSPWDVVYKWERSCTTQTGILRVTRISYNFSHISCHSSFLPFSLEQHAQDLMLRSTVSRRATAVLRRHSLFLGSSSNFTASTNSCSSVSPPQKFYNASSTRQYSSSQAVFGEATDFLKTYTAHIDERQSEHGIVPLPLDVEQVSTLVSSIKSASGEELESCLHLLSHRVPPGVDEAAYVKAAYLSSVALGEEAEVAGLDRMQAITLLGTMQGGYNVQTLVTLLSDSNADLAAHAATQLKYTLLVFDMFHDVQGGSCIIACIIACIIVCIIVCIIAFIIAFIIAYTSISHF